MNPEDASLIETSCPSKGCPRSPDRGATLRHWGQSDRLRRGYFQAPRKCPTGCPLPSAIWKVLDGDESPRIRTLTLGWDRLLAAERLHQVRSIR